MGERASISYLEKLGSDDTVITNFYGHWVADGTLDILAQAVEGQYPHYIKSNIAKAFDDLYGPEYDIAPYFMSNNYPLLAVRRLGGTTEIYLSMEEIDNPYKIDWDSPLWVPADVFIQAVRSTLEYSYYDRFHQVSQILYKEQGAVSA